MDTQLIKAIQNVAENVPEILVGYCFGSTVSGYASRESDLDLAFVVKDKTKITPKELHHVLGTVHFPNDVDISVVDKNSSPLFLFEIVKNGQRIYTKDPAIAESFEAYVLRTYYDTEHLRTIYFNYLKEKFPLP